MDVYSELWERAEETAKKPGCHGIKIQTDNVRELTRKLYAARKATGVGEGFRIAQIADEGWIWIAEETIDVIDIQ
jgi:hypothetical protein